MSTIKKTICIVFGGTRGWQFCRWAKSNVVGNSTRRCSSLVKKIIIFFFFFVAFGGAPHPFSFFYVELIRLFIFAIAPENCTAWVNYAELEQGVGENDRARAIYELAVNQEVIGEFKKKKPTATREREGGTEGCYLCMCVKYAFRNAPRGCGCCSGMMSLILTIYLWLRVCRFFRYARAPVEDVH